MYNIIENVQTQDLIWLLVLGNSCPAAAVETVQQRERGLKHRSIVILGYL